MPKIFFQILGAVAAAALLTISQFWACSTARSVCPKVTQRDFLAEADLQLMVVRSMEPNKLALTFEDRSLLEALQVEHPRLQELLQQQGLLIEGLTKQYLRQQNIAFKQVYWSSADLELKIITASPTTNQALEIRLAQAGGLQELMAQIQHSSDNQQGELKDFFENQEFKSASNRVLLLRLLTPIAPDDGHQLSELNASDGQHFEPLATQSNAVLYYYYHPLSIEDLAQSTVDWELKDRCLVPLGVAAQLRRGPPVRMYR